MPTTKDYQWNQSDCYCYVLLTTIVCLSHPCALTTFKSKLTRDVIFIHKCSLVTHCSELQCMDGEAGVGKLKGRYLICSTRQILRMLTGMSSMLLTRDGLKQDSSNRGSPR